jgi:solute:Na+ symporter, SSS family
MRAMVVLISLFSMSIAILAEYTAIASLFKDFVGTLDYPIIIVTGVLTMAYTSCVGGPPRAVANEIMHSRLPAIR